MRYVKPFSGLVGGKQVHGYGDWDISVGLWGLYPSSDQVEFVRANCEIEAKMRELRGSKWLYSRLFYSEDEWCLRQARVRQAPLEIPRHVSTFDMGQDHGSRAETRLWYGSQGLIKGACEKQCVLIVRKEQVYSDLAKHSMVGGGCYISYSQR